MNNYYIGIDYEDLPIQDKQSDSLEMNKYAHSLSNFINNINGPFTIAIQGEWGSGKSSLMNLIRKELKENNEASFIDININAWEFYLNYNSENFIESILKEILKEIIKSICINSNKELFPYLQILIQKASRLIKCSIKDLCESIEINNIYNEISSEITLNPIREFRHNLNKLIEEAKKRNRSLKGFVFFIDDIDRLSPTSAVELIEVLKNIFDIKNCVFLLAVDYNIITTGLKQKLGDTNLEKNNICNAYFDKLIQLSFVMPISSYNAFGYLFEKLIKINFFSSTDKITPKDKYKLSHILLYSLRNNPRQIKRLINSVSLSVILNDSIYNFNSVAYKIVNILLYIIQYTYPLIYEYLLLKPDFENWHLTSPKKDVSNTSEWKLVLNQLCQQSEFTKNSYHIILYIFDYIISLLATDNAKNKKLVYMLKLSSITYNNSMNNPIFEFDGNLYTRHSDIQMNQGNILLEMVLPIENAYILDVGCGNGKTTIKLLNKFPKCKIDAIDISETQLNEARRIYNESARKTKQIIFRKQDIMTLNKIDEYDVVFSNSTMHWISPLDEAYKTLYAALKPTGYMYLHQGSTNTYCELHNAAKQSYKELELDYCFDNWNFPATYLSKDTIYSILLSIGFSDIRIDDVINKDDNVESIIDDFIVSSLPAYIKCIPKEMSNEYIKKFREICKENISSITVHRLFITARKNPFQ